MMIDYLLSLIYPDSCIFCGKPIKLHSENRDICDDCLLNMPYLSESIDMERINIKGISVFTYDALRDTVFRLKYDGYKRYGNILGLLMADYAEDKGLKEIFDADIIAPVPLWHKKEKQRGFNQSELLADEVALRMGIPCIGNLLIRNRYTKAQMSLDAAERYENLRGAFSFNPQYDIKDKRILLIDDIVTSGSTVYECAKTLAGEGAQNVMYFSLSSPGGEYRDEYKGNEFIRKI